MFFKTLEQCLLSGNKFDSEEFKVTFKQWTFLGQGLIILCMHQRDFVRRQGAPFTTSRTLFPTEEEGDTIEVRNHNF